LSRLLPPSNSCGGSLSPIYSEQRNNTDNTWFGTMVICGSGSAGKAAQNRSYSWTEHIDTVTGAAYALLKADPNGIIHGQLVTNWAYADVNPISWSSSVEWDPSLYSGPTGSNCSKPRTTGFGELTGADGVTRAYASVCDQILVRIDGSQDTCTSTEQVQINGNRVNRWQEYWTTPSVNESSNGLRGFTAIQAESILMIGYEGSTSTTATADEHL
jgi:hypothetical protein